MLEQYVSPGNKIIDLVASLQLPFASVRRGEEVAIVTDTAWIADLPGGDERGAEQSRPDAHDVHAACSSHRRTHPGRGARARGADICVFFTTTARRIRVPEHRGNKGVLMEEATVDHLTGMSLKKPTWN
jgi:hypothetical protein